MCILVVCLLEATNDNKNKPLVIKTIFSDLKINYISLYNAIKILPNIDFEADPINKTKPWNIKTSLFDFKINEISLYNAIKILLDPINKIKTLIRTEELFFPISKSIQFPFLTRL